MHWGLLHIRSQWTNRFAQLQDFAVALGQRGFRQTSLGYHAKMKRFLFGLLALVGLLLVWGVAEPYFIDEQTHEVPLPNLPASLEGRQVAVIADLQVGMWLANTWTVQRIVARLVEAKPAAVLIAGDFVYHADGSSPAITQAVSLVAPLVAAGIPTYAVLGNHDYAMPTGEAPKNTALADAVQSALEDAGITVLQNEAAPLPTAQAEALPLYIVGVGAHVAAEDRPEAALAAVPNNAPRIVLMHHPESFKAFPADTAPLAVSGHTHGGQFRLPFTPSWTWMSYAREDEVHADGFIQNYGEPGNRLYVNRGIGFSVVPLRLNAPPELTLFILRKENSEASTR